MAKLKWVLLFGACLVVGLLVGSVLKSAPDRGSGVSDSPAAQAPGGESAPDNSMTWSITVGSKPWAVALSPGGDVAYVANQQSGTVTFVQTRKQRVAATVEVGKLPSAMALDAQNGLLYVANNGDDSLSVVDIDKRTIVATVPVGDGPSGIALDGGTGLVTNFGAATVSIVDLATRSVASVVPVGKGPSAVVVDGRRAYVTNSADRTLSVIDLDARTVIATVDLGDRPYSLAADPASRRVLVTGVDADKVIVVDTQSLQVSGHWTVGHGPQGIGIDPGSGVAYVTVDGRGLALVNGEDGTLRSAVGVGAAPNAVTVDPKSHLVVVANSGDRSISVRQP